MNANTQSRMVQLGLAALLGLGAVAVMTTASEVDASVNEVNPACSNANVVLSVGFDGNKDQELNRLRTFFENKRVWRVVGAEGPGPDDYQAGVAGKIQIRTWEVTARYNGGPEKAFTVHCGAGGTCNEIAKLWASEYKDWKPAPYLWCGDMNAVLSNPTVESPKP
ncbi:MAG: hypothetical protein FJ096_06915 [Deltaproteobacteria bacterium]|nr:hypothetical protein [Deltaproteobacteria bacterium]